MRFFRYRPARLQYLGIADDDDGRRTQPPAGKASLAAATSSAYAQPSSIPVHRRSSNGARRTAADDRRHRLLASVYSSIVGERNWQVANKPYRCAGKDADRTLSSPAASRTAGDQHITPRSLRYDTSSVPTTTATVQPLTMMRLAHHPTRSPQPFLQTTKSPMKPQAQIMASVEPPYSDYYCRPLP